MRPFGNRNGIYSPLKCNDFFYLSLQTPSKRSSSEAMAIFSVQESHLKWWGQFRTRVKFLCFKFKAKSQLILNRIWAFLSLLDNSQRIFIFYVAVSNRWLELRIMNNKYFRVVKINRRIESWNWKCNGNCSCMIGVETKQMNIEWKKQMRIYGSFDWSDCQR